VIQEFSSEHPAAAPATYAHLRELAAAYLRRERRSHTLQPTALVHEAIIRLLASDSSATGGALVQAAARAMRHVLVDHARRHGAVKRGPGTAERLPLDATLVEHAEGGPDLLALDEALGRLGTHDRELLAIVELRFFGGLTEEQTARCLGVSTRTVTRGWRFARLWLARELAGGEDA
jgi:RNA polymerase sigma factor (TIGR02999 family)